MEINRLNQAYNQKTSKPGAMKQALSPFGSDMVSISGEKPAGMISPKDYSKFFKPESTRINWTYKWGDDNQYSVRGSMVSKDGSLYTASRGLIRKLNPDDGSVMWEKDFWKDNTKTIDSHPATESIDGKILVTTNDKKLHALEPKTGTVAWKYEMETHSSSYETPVGPDGTIFTRHKRDMVALTPDGKEKYTFPIEDEKHQVRYIEKDGTAYVESDRGVFAINPDGSEKWHAPGNEVERFPSDPSRIYTVEDKWLPDPNPEKRGVRVLHNNLVGRDPNTGQKLWERMFKTVQIPNAVGGRLFVREPRKIHCLDAASGRTLWEKEYDIMPDIKMVGDDGTLYVNGYQNLEALDPGSGKVKWETKMEDTDGGSVPAMITDSGILLTSDEKKIYGLNPKDGIIQFKHHLPNGIEKMTLSGDQKSLIVEEMESPNIKSVDFRTAAETAKAIVEEESREEDPGKITVEKNYVEIGGVRIPRRKRD